MDSKLVLVLEFIFSCFCSTIRGFLLTQSLSHPLRLGAFNGHVFGRAKMSDAQRADVFAKIVERYDIFLLEEIRDSTGTSIRELQNIINKVNSYNYTISPLLGRSSYKEQYAFFYRTDRVILVADWQDNDPLDVFEREPFCARFRPVGNGITVSIDFSVFNCDVTVELMNIYEIMRKFSNGVSWDFAVVGIHTHPDITLSKQTVKEIEGLYDVKQRLHSTWPGVHDIIFMGDFNGDCHYVAETDLKNLPIYNMTEFHWLIDFRADTTTKHTTDCAYDRIVVSGPHIIDAVVNGSATVYHFENDYHLTYNEMLHISDHYPVEVTIH